MKAPRFFICKHCKNIITMVEDKGVPVVCCGEKMTELKANTSDGAGEKHVPVVQVEGSKVTVKVGEVTHPMLEEHHIAWKPARAVRSNIWITQALPKQSLNWQKANRQ